jgi:hypothetical protein
MVKCFSLKDGKPVCEGSKGAKKNFSTSKYRQHKKKGKPKPKAKALPMKTPTIKKGKAVSVKKSVKKGVVAKFKKKRGRPKGSKNKTTTKPKVSKTKTKVKPKISKKEQKAIAKTIRVNKKLKKMDKDFAKQTKKTLSVVEKSWEKNKSKPLPKSKILKPSNKPVSEPYNNLIIKKVGKGLGMFMKMTDTGKEYSLDGWRNWMRAGIDFSKGIKKLKLHKGWSKKELYKKDVLPVTIGEHSKKLIERFAKSGNVSKALMMSMFINTIINGLERNRRNYNMKGQEFFRDTIDENTPGFMQKYSQSKFTFQNKEWAQESPSWGYEELPDKEATYASDLYSIYYPIMRKTMMDGEFINDWFQLEPFLERIWSMKAGIYTKIPNIKGKQISISF